MFLTRGKFGWFIPIKSKDIGGNELSQNLQVSFKKGTEIDETLLNEYGSVPARMYIETNGERRECFLSVYLRKNGETGMKMVILDNENELEKPKKRGIQIDESDLPFY